MIGNLCEHANTCGGGTSVFIEGIQGGLIYIHDGKAVEAKSPYLNQYGECHSLGNFK